MSAETEFKEWLKKAENDFEGALHQIDVAKSRYRI